VKVCTGYRVGRDIVTDFPEEEALLAKVEPVYEEISGWIDVHRRSQERVDLPAKRRRYLERLEELIGVPFCLISTGASATKRFSARTRPLLDGTRACGSSIV